MKFLLSHLYIYKSFFLNKIKEKEKAHVIVVLFD